MTKDPKVHISKTRVLHAARHIVQMEIMLNHQIDKFLETIGLTREVITNVKVDNKPDSVATEERKHARRSDNLPRKTRDGYYQHLPAVERWAGGSD